MRAPRRSENRIGVAAQAASSGPRERRASTSSARSHTRHATKRLRAVARLDESPDGSGRCAHGPDTSGTRLEQRICRRLDTIHARNRVEDDLPLRRGVVGRLHLEESHQIAHEHADVAGSKSGSNFLPRRFVNLAFLNKSASSRRFRDRERRCYSSLETLKSKSRDESRPLRRAGDRGRTGDVQLGNLILLRAPEQLVTSGRRFSSPRTPARLETIASREDEAIWKRPATYLLPEITWTKDVTG
jgi:hypothetical protein